MTGRNHFPDGFAVRLLAGGLTLTLLAAAVAAGTNGRPAPRAADPAPKTQRPPEEEDPNAKPVKTHRVSVDDADDAGAKTPAAPQAGDLQQAARDARHFAVKQLFHELEVPHDVVKYEYGKKRTQNIAPYPDYIGANRDAIPEHFTITPLSDSWKPDDAEEAKRATVVAVKPYEEVALEAVDQFLGANYAKSGDPATFLSRRDQDVAAARALTAVLLFHQSAKARDGRRGDAWQPVEDKLKQKLLGVQLDELNELASADAPDWNAAFALTQRLADAYHGEADRERIAAPLTGLVKKNLLQGSLNDQQKDESRRRLVQLQELFPRSQVLAPVTEELHKQAKSLFDEARQAKDPEQVGRLLNEAEEAWPTLPGLRAFQLERRKGHPTLRVGVRELPTLLSPALAVSDSDLRAVDLLFEGLMKLSPDGAGGCRWAPALAEGRPRLTPGGREFRLPENACWSDGQLLRAVDFRSTVEQLKKGRAPRRPRVWADLLDDVNVVDPTRVDLTLRQGWLDPLALMNFKVLPPGVDSDSVAFAEHPLGSGPFVYGGTGAKDGRTCAYFPINPYYGTRADKAGLPHLQEIRFFTYKDPVDELKSGRLDLILDLTAKEAADVRAKADALGVRVPPSAVPNRRIYFLAVNGRKPALASAPFRCALAYAINREALLDDFFRAAPGELHTPLNGPYPIHSWASNPTLVRKHGDKVVLDPFTVEGAKAKMTDAALHEVPTLQLKYPAGDPAVAAAMTKLCAQVKETLGVTLTPTAVSEKDLHRDVEETASYDLAYYHYDFPDDVYWLGPLLDPAAGKDGENYLGYKGVLTAMIQDESRRRDFADVQARAREMHDLFLNKEMPFIPLWQLDALAAVRDGVDAPPFDPRLPFTDVERWRLK